MANHSVSSIEIIKEYRGHRRINPVKRKGEIEASYWGKIQDPDVLLCAYWLVIDFSQQEVEKNFFPIFGTQRFLCKNKGKNVKD